MQKGFGAANKVLMVGIDGMDPIYTQKLLDEGKLPNIENFLKRGTTTKNLGMMGVLPTYTPPSWCTLATGAWPGTHGITCFWTHTAGDPLSKLSLGFNSKLCKVDYIWDAFAAQGKKSIVYGWPTSWPPRDTENTIMIDGSGIHPFLSSEVDFEKVIECKESEKTVRFISHADNASGAECFVTETIEEHEFQPISFMASEMDNVIGSEGSERDNFDCRLDQVFAPIKPATGWANAPENAKESVYLVNAGVERRYILILSDDGKVYNRVQVYKDKTQKQLLGEATVGNWIENIHDVFTAGNEKMNVAYYLNIMELEEDGSALKMFYSFAVSLDDDSYASPVGIKKELFDKFGAPLMLTSFYEHDASKLQMMWECAEKAFTWSMDTIDYLLDTKEWDGAFHGLHIIDFANHVHLESTVPENPDHEVFIEYLEKYYVLADDYVGRAMKWLDKGVSVIVASDHGGLLKYPGYKVPAIGDAWGLNTGIMEELGYTKTKMVDGVLEIDWENTKAIAQRSSYIYVNLKGRDPQGIVEPEELDDLVTQIISDLYSYRDHKHGERVISCAFRRNEMAVLGLSDLCAENLGDIFFILEPKFTRDQGNSFSNTEIMGTSIQCIFMMAGEGIKEDFIIRRDVQEVDLVPTLCHLVGVNPPDGVEGGVLYQALK